MKKKHGVFLYICLTLFLLHTYEAIAKNDPEGLISFKYAVNVFESWDKNKNYAPYKDDKNLDKNVCALIACYSFFIDEGELHEYTTVTLKDILKVIEIMKTDNSHSFKKEPLLSRKNAYLSLEKTIRRTLNSRIVKNREKIQHILKREASQK